MTLSPGGGESERLGEVALSIIPGFNPPLPLRYEWAGASPFTGLGVGPLGFLGPFRTPLQCLFSAVLSTYLRTQRVTVG